MASTGQQMRDHYTDLRSIFNHAELAIKKAEYLTESALIPAINQLRYAGFHMTMSLVAEGGYSAAHIDKAINHCKRALYDAIEAQIVVYLGTIRLFQEDFRSVVIADLFPEYPEWIGKVRIAQEFLERHSLNGADVHLTGDDVDLSDWDVPGDVLSEARKHVADLESARYALENVREELTKKRSKDRKTALVAVWALIFTIIGAVLTLVSLWV